MHAGTGIDREEGVRHAERPQDQVRRPPCRGDQRAGARVPRPRRRRTARQDGRLQGAPGRRRSPRRPPARSLRQCPRGSTAHPRPPPLRRPAHGRHLPPPGQHRRDEDRRGQDPDGDPAGLPQRADRARRPRRHRQRLPRQARRRLDGPRLPRPRHDRWRRRPQHAGRPEEGRLRRRHHLRDQQRARLRLPPRQHEVGAPPGPPARSLLRHCRRGRLDPHRRGAHPPHHLRPEPGPLRTLHRHRQADPRASARALRPRREAAHHHPHRRGQRVRRGPASRDGPPRCRRDDVRPREHQRRPPRQPGAPRPRPLPPRQGLHRPQRRGDAHRRVHRPHDAGPAPLRGPPPGDRGQGRRQDPPGERHARQRHLPELLPPLRQARRHDRHRRDRGRGVLRDLQARRRRGADQPPRRPQGPRRPGLPHRPREIRVDRRGDRSAPTRPASRSSSAPPRSRSPRPSRRC